MWGIIDQKFHAPRYYYVLWAMYFLQKGTPIHPKGIIWRKINIDFNYLLRCGLYPWQSHFFTQHEKVISEKSIKILNIFLEQHFELSTDVTNVPDLQYMHFYILSFILTFHLHSLMDNQGQLKHNQLVCINWWPELHFSCDFRHIHVLYIFLLSPGSPSSMLLPE